jgi:hypothetical protein
MSEAIAGAAVETNLRAFFTSNDAEAVVLDLVQPLAVGRQFRGFCRKARRDESGREGTLLQHADLIRSGNSSSQILVC